MRKTLAAILAGGVLMGATASHAAGNTAIGTLTVQASVSDACSVSNATLGFGAVTLSTGTVAPVGSNISVTCTLGTPFTVGLDNGQNASGGVRRMQGASGVYLNYQLYQDLLMTKPFGDTGSSDREAGLGLGIGATPISVYGTIASGQNVGSGSYSDSVKITVYY